MYEKEHEVKLDLEWMKGKSYAEAFSGEKLKIAHAYPHQEDFFEDLDVFPHGPEVMKELYEKHDVFIVSAAMEYPYSLKPKRDWLARHFPFIHWKNIVFCGDKSIIDADFLIDDHAYNLETFRGQALIYSALHNLNETRFERMNNWQEIGQKFL